MRKGPGNVYGKWNTSVVICDAIKPKSLTRMANIGYGHMLTTS